MLKPAPFNIIHPADQTELATLINEPQSHFKLLAGGTDLVNSLKKRLYPISTVISLNKIPDIKNISYNQSQDQLTIGATATLSQIKSAPEILQHQPAIAKAINLIAAPPIRNQATIGGNLCLDTRCYFFNQSESWRKLAAPCFKFGGDICNAAPGAQKCQAVFSADLPPLLIALNAEVTINNSSGEKTILLQNLYSGKGAAPIILQTNEYISKISIKNLKTKKAIYKKFRLRKALDFPLAGVALAFDDNSEKKFINPKIILNAVASGPLAVPEAEAFLNGKTFNDAEAIAAAAEAAAKAAKPIANVGSKPFYRKKMIGLLLKKIVAELAAEQEA